MGQRLKITNLDIEAFLDGEVSLEEDMHMRMALEIDSEAKKFYETLSEQKAILKRYWINKSM
jgi:hypothetical protein